MIKLEILNDELAGREIQLREDLTIGSAEACTVKAKHKKMFPNHARFYIDSDSHYHVEAVDADARIYLNGKDVLTCELRHGDKIAVGPLRFKVIDESMISATNNRLDQLLNGIEDGEEEIYDFATEDLFYLTNKDPSLRERISFFIPSKDRFIDQAQQFLSRLAHQSGMDEMKIEGFMTCLKELILNAHRHGHQYDEEKTITVRYADRGDALEVTIEDQGDGFDHQQIIDKAKNTDAAAAARERYQSGGFGGLGFKMITRMAHKLEYNEPGNVVTFSVTKEL